MLALLLATSCQRAETVEPVGAAVVVVVLDGVRVEESTALLPSEATDQFPWQGLPRIWNELVPEGVIAESAWNLGSTTTSPAHCAMTSGRRQALANYPVTDEPGVYRPELPSLMEAIRADGADRDEVVVMGSSMLVKPIAHSLWPGDGYATGADFVMVYDNAVSGEPASTDAQVVDAMIARLERTRPRFVLANLHQADRAGHYGPENAYPDAVAAMDGPVADLWAWLQASEAYADQTWMVVVSDHGRHHHEGSDPAWRHHGDACSSCRQVPLLLLGPGVKAGERVDVPVTLTDLGPTLAALLGLELPFAAGRVADELFETELGTDRAGVSAFAQAGGVRAEVRYTDDPAHRTELVVDGERLSSDAATAVAAPAMAADDDAAYVCFRELTLDGSDWLPWVPRCFADAGEGWEELVTPVDEVGPFWEPALAVSEGELLLAYNANPNGLAATASDVLLRVLALGDEGWEPLLEEEGMTFPTGAGLVQHRGSWLVTGGVSDATDEARDTRRLVVRGEKVRAELDLAELAGEHEWRLERPALRSAGDERLELAALAYERGQVVVVRTASEDGRSWSGATRVDSPPVLPHVTPVWADDALVFAVAGDAGAEVCWQRDELVCVPAGGELLQLAEDEGQVLALVRDGAWSVVALDEG